MGRGIKAVGELETFVSIHLPQKMTAWSWRNAGQNARRHQNAICSSFWSTGKTKEGVCFLMHQVMCMPTIATQMPMRIHGRKVFKAPMASPRYVPTGGMSHGVNEFSRIHGSLLCQAGLIARHQLLLHVTM